MLFDNGVAFAWWKDMVDGKKMQSMSRMWEGWLSQ